MTSNEALSAAERRGPEDRPGNEADYAAIEVAVMETARGRWFLAEYARRNRNADTKVLLDTLARIETLLRSRNSVAAVAEPETPPAPPASAPDTPARLATVPAAETGQTPNPTGAESRPAPLPAAAPAAAIPPAPPVPQPAIADPRDIEAPPLQARHGRRSGLGIDLSDLTFDEKIALFS